MVPLVQNKVPLHLGEARLLPAVVVPQLRIDLPQSMDFLIARSQVVHVDVAGAGAGCCAVIGARRLLRKILVNALDMLMAPIQVTVVAPTLERVIPIIGLVATVVEGLVATVVGPASLVGRREQACEGGTVLGRGVAGVARRLEVVLLRVVVLVLSVNRLISLLTEGVTGR